MQLVTIILCMSMFSYKVNVIEAQTVDIVQTAINDGNFNTLVTALQTADLVTTLKGAGPFTVFAPTDAAFSKLPAGTVADLLKPENKAQLTRILTYHVTNGITTSAQINAMTLPAQVNMLGGGPITITKVGTSIKVNDATVIIPDVGATNGIIHAIDTVLMPPVLNIVQIATNLNFTTLVAALGAADLVTTLQGIGPFTVFAPTDAAFSKLPAGSTVTDLLKPENKETLTRILKYHVIGGQSLTSTQIIALGLPTKVNMLDGGQITVSLAGTNLKVNDATVTLADVDATNGIIHAIDAVLIPPEPSLATPFSMNQSLSLTLILTVLCFYIHPF